MKRRRNNENSQVFFGLKCILLAAAILLIASTLILHYLLPEFSTGELHIILNIIAMIIVAIVMVFEIKPYIQLSNTAIRKIYREKDIEIENFGKFNRMVDNNTFNYCFQPIIDARNGNIFAYEALMRSPTEVGLIPRDILKYAEISQQLYSIEFFTFLNTLRLYSENLDKFQGRRIFINSIPSVMLSGKDLTMLSKEFGDIAKNAVVEILEDDEDTTESCAYFEKLRSIFKCQIAIDDFGSGYANESKLLNNNPNYIKIDISLISSIDSDKKKQLLVSNIIQFASKYDIKVLAEGVETREELQTLIGLGVDLIQGFYVARPNLEIINEISPSVKDFIIAENIRISKFDNDRKVYETKDGEIVSLLDLAVKKYVGIFVTGGTVTVVGEPNHEIEMSIKCARDSECTINIENTNMVGLMDPVIMIDKLGKLKLNVIGENIMSKEGIYVPEDAELEIVGDGNLTINGSRNNGTGIGTNYNENFGAITVNMNGNLTVNCSGDKTVCIGGYSQKEGTAVKFLTGNISVTGRGIKGIGVGCVDGSFTFTNSALLKVDISGNEVIGVGCENGFVDIVNSGGSLTTSIEGDKLVGIGNFSGDNGRIHLSGGRIESSVRGKKAMCIGSLYGSAQIVSSADYVNAYGEGVNVTGIGSGGDGGSLTIVGGTVRSFILSGEACWFGSNGKHIVITGGNIVTNCDNLKIEAVNSFGEALSAEKLEQNSYEKRLITQNSDYVYRAVKIPEVEYLQVFIPFECISSNNT